MHTNITFTGIDNKTDIEELKSIQQAYPQVEFGLLVALSRQGNEPRYPDLRILKDLKGAGLNLSCHVCGTLARNLVRTGDITELDAFLGKGRGLGLDLFQRIQINVSNMDFELKQIPSNGEFVVPESIREVIIQHHPGRPLSWTSNNAGVPISVLFDPSGGLGLGWQKIDIPYYAKNLRCGFAGGINASNVEKWIRTLQKEFPREDFWLDMESGVRTDDVFDTGKVREVLDIVSKMKPETFSKGMSKEDFCYRYYAFFDRDDELKKEIKRNKLAREAFVAAYEKEAFDASGYHFGQKIEVEGEFLYVTGAYADGCGNVFLKLNRSKKDGTMSKVRRWTLLAPQIK